MLIINSVFTRKRSVPRLERMPRYVNYDSEVVDGVVKYTPSEVVAPALASASSVSMNVLTARSRVPLRGRKICDAVDLESELSKIK